ncbi:IS200/IS605 family element transposase accessory protein TnpB [Streptomyces luteolifulvus]|uniref:IS200/IS605 family element transposase accessory protein TnpB n=1 Tax=Streptomyces luteolifulvus TaxID=2615112 RepID=A0A6H9UQG4_9ACTN|nr:RNA-guided endonuclease TnpB family protein [Streptomyces luteolifulvus]KAB1140674.1 IS200/IS605 family element transposase accessory protein TnpB [Streptomyces luteolifulvus]
MTRQVKRAFKYRFYPTGEQAAELSRTFGCVRLVYNKALEQRTRAWYGEQRRISYVQSSAALTQWKKTGELAFLSEVSSVPLQQALRRLQTAFANFFAKRAKYPRYKSRKKSRASAEYTRSAFTWRDGKLTLAKMTDPLDIRWSRPLPEGAEPTTATVSRDSVGRWFVSLLCQESIAPAPATDAAVGLDAGITSLVTLSTGEKVANPKHERRDRARLARAQRDLSRKAKGSANREKARRRVAGVHARIADRRRDFLHKLSTRLVRENQTVVIEDLTVRNLLKNGTLARAVSDAAWTDLRMMLEYKCAWYGRTLVVIDRWFPSSKLCGACGTVRGKLPLNVPAWTCDCGTVHDRDVNAARNILAAGLAASACGDGARPQRESSRTGQSSVKQETQRATAGIPRP